MKKILTTHNDGDTRVIRKFLFFPETLAPTINIDPSEIEKLVSDRVPFIRRWLEFAYIIQTYTKIDETNHYRNNINNTQHTNRHRWINSHWADINLTDTI